MIPVLVAALVLLVATGVHEFGHFVAARARHARVVRVSVGRGPRVVGFRRGESFYELRLLPIGGRVDFQRPESGAANAVIAVGGAVANVAFGFAVLWAAAGGLGVDQMPFGDASLDPLRYASGATTAWLRVVPATIVEYLTHGHSRTFALAVDTLARLVHAASAADLLHTVAAVSVVWAALNMIPIPGLGTDGWRFITAFGAPWDAAAAHSVDEDSETRRPTAASTDRATDLDDSPSDLDASLSRDES